MKGKTFDDILKMMRKESKNTVDLGDKFENLIFEYFKTDSVYTNRFEQVWKWSDWARENNIKDKIGTSHDLGVDIVGQERGGTLCAIQCKCYDDGTVLEKSGVDSFLAAGRTYKMDNYILACTGPINDNAMAMIRGVNGNIITKEHLRNSGIVWSKYPEEIKQKKPKTLREEQQNALNDVEKGFKENDRGKMIMACGTGKTLVSLRIAEKLVGKDGTVLYLVPSISLILQSMREWSDNRTIPHYYMAVCSDKSIRNSDDGTLTELEMPASTDPGQLSEKLSKRSPDTMNVIFSTYHSIEVVMKSLHSEKIDLILCDEAHRTTGVTDKTAKESFLTKVHDDDNIKSKHRLYMTATPRIYTDVIKNKALQKEKVIISMDDELIYGPEFHNLSFYDAVHKYHVLSDFKVRVAVMDGDTMDAMIQKSVANDENLVPLNEKTLMTSVWHALEYPGVGDEKDLLQRVIVFCDMINSSKLFAGDTLSYKKDVKEDVEKFEKIKEIDENRSFVKLVEHIKKVKNDDDSTKPEVRHVDGGDNAQRRRRELDWLRDSHNDPKMCRMLSNARCLSEGVDVPALDGVVFMNPRKSVVDVVQAVGRVMRKSPGKDFGYVVLPVAIPASVNIDDALKDSKHFKVVWQVLNALRSHDPNFADEINRLILDPVTGKDNEITNRIIIRHANSHNLANADMPVDRMIRGISTKLIEKVGDVDYYDKYGRNLGHAASEIETILTNRMSRPDVKAEVKKLQEGLKRIINDSISQKETIRVISQHMVMSRVFDALFQGEFTSQNPVSVILLDVVKKLNLVGELEKLEEFYLQVEAELQNITTRETRQNFIKKIYENFFKATTKKETEQHGIVYTPVEIVDFIINSVQHVLKKEFDIEFSDRSVKVLEPFAGTGTFLTRLLESGYLDSNLDEKYKHDLYANELILLAYYIATVNIETTYSSLSKGKYVPFDGISYTDTLKSNPRYSEGKEHRHEQETLDGTFTILHKRIKRQRSSNLNVIMGNPPYSSGQSNFNDQNPNVSYKILDKRIEDTYLRQLKKINPIATQIRSLYDSYVRSIRWASDRIGESGIVAFVTNGSFLKSDTGAGIRASLHEEFTDVWCFDLRGNARTQGDTRKREGGGVFGFGSRAPVAITILIRNPKKKKTPTPIKNSKKKKPTIHYKDIGDCLSIEKKLEKIVKAKSIDGIEDWVEISHDKHHDWMGKRNPEFEKYSVMGSKKVKAGKSTNAIFKIYSRGVGTSRDAWTCNSSKKKLTENMKNHIKYCNKQDPNNPKFDPTKAKITSGLIQKLKIKRTFFKSKKIRCSLYRPFFKQFLYFDDTGTYNERPGLISKFFPKKDSKNLTICIPDKGETGMFSSLITNITPDLHLIESSHCFPLYMDGNKEENILNSTLQEYQTYYEDEKITKEDIFYYIYGMLHWEKYKETFADNLSKELPRIPMAPDFRKFNEAGQALAYLHLNYETCPLYKIKHIPEFGNLEKMSFPKTNTNGKLVPDKTKIKINGILAFEGVPEIKYRVNGRTPIEWAIDRYKVSIDKDSGITNEPTSDMTEERTTEMIQRLIYVGVESDKIIAALSELPFEPENYPDLKTGLDA